MAFSSLTGLTSPLPWTANSGHPNVTSPVRLTGLRSPLPQFAPNNNGTVWANPLTVIPIKPLPGVPATVTGQAGYAQ